MKSIKINIPNLLILTLFLPVFLISCEEENITDNTPDRLFRPALLTAGVDGNKVRPTALKLAATAFYFQPIYSRFHWMVLMNIRWKIYGVIRYILHE